MPKSIQVQVRPMNSVWWVKRDFRVSDNECLFRAMLNGGGVTPFFCWEPKIVDSGDYSIFHFQAQWQALSGEQHASARHCHCRRHVGAAPRGARRADPVRRERVARAGAGALGRGAPPPTHHWCWRCHGRGHGPRPAARDTGEPRAQADAQARSQLEFSVSGARLRARS